MSYATLFMTVQAPSALSGETQVGASNEGWSLPSNPQPGKWMSTTDRRERDGVYVPTLLGIVNDPQQLWFEKSLYEVECRTSKLQPNFTQGTTGDILGYFVDDARLARQVKGWTLAQALRFSAACIEHVLEVCSELGSDYEIQHIAAKVIEDTRKHADEISRIEREHPTMQWWEKWQQLRAVSEISSEMPPVSETESFLERARNRAAKQIPGERYLAEAVSRISINSGRVCADCRLAVQVLRTLPWKLWQEQSEQERQSVEAEWNGIASTELRWQANTLRSILYE